MRQIMNARHLIYGFDDCRDRADTRLGEPFDLPMRVFFLQTKLS